VSAAERVSEHVWRLALPSRTLPPFDTVNTYLIAAAGVGAVVDPGSPDAEAPGRIRAALDDADVRLLKAVFLTHTHPDHVDGLPALLEAEGPLAVYVHPLEAERLGDATGVVALGDERRITVGDAVVRALHTPGHSPGHLSYLLEDGVALVGDVVAGRGSTWVGVPEGDVSAYLDTVARLRAQRPSVLGPGHGQVVREADRKLADSAAHRLERERQVLRSLAMGPLVLPALRDDIYPDLPEAVRTLAERSLLAHLAKLMRELKVVHLGDDEQGPYALRR
jgi:ribonuclease/clavin/mitogillin